MKFSFRNSFFYLACVGWLAALALHIVSIFGINPGPGIWIVGAAIFPVWVAFIRRLQRENASVQSPLTWSQSRRLRVPVNRMFRHAPKWLTVFLIVTAVYSFANFFY